MGAMENLFEYTLKGALVLAGLLLAFIVLFIAAVTILPFAIGYLIAQPLVLKFFPSKKPVVYHEKSLARIMLDAQEEKAKAELVELQRSVYPEPEKLEAAEQNMNAETQEPKVEEEQEETEDEPEEEFILNRNFYVERKLSHKEKEALYAQGYSRLKISPYGDSGAAYYWVKTRYNESKEHAFFCYLIEKELRKYTKQVELFINNGPDVIVRHAGNVYAFDVETGSNLIRKPEETRIKFERYRNDYYRSYIFVTNKALKRSYQSMGTVITRATFKKTISDIFY